MIPKGLLPLRRADAHKGDCGHVFVVAGSVGMAGAAALCATGALRAGAGLVTLIAPEALHDPLTAKLSEPLLVLAPQTAAGAFALRAIKPVLARLKDADVSAIGPGLSLQRETVRFVRKLLPGVASPVVVDADGLNAIAGETKLLLRVSGRAVITPHPGEMARLTGRAVADVQRDRAGAAKAFAKRHGVVVALKGSGTVVASPSGNVYINETGNAGMASGGMGDVLTGVIAALMGQRLSPYDAACLGVYLHGLAGDAAARDLGSIGLIAGDVAARIPLAIRQYQQPDPVSRC